MRALMHHDWPGNVRELQNLLLRLNVLMGGRTVTESDIEPYVTSGSRSDADLLEMPYKDARRASQERFTYSYLEGALARSGGNIAEAARRCGIRRQYLQAKVSELGIDAGRFRPVR